MFIARLGSGGSFGLSEDGYGKLNIRGNEAERKRNRKEGEKKR